MHLRFQELEEELEIPDNSESIRQRNCLGEPPSVRRTSTTHLEFVLPVVERPDRAFNMYETIKRGAPRLVTSTRYTIEEQCNLQITVLVEDWFQGDFVELLRKHELYSDYDVEFRHIPCNRWKPRSSTIFTFTTLQDVSLLRAEQLAREEVLATVEMLQSQLKQLGILRYPLSAPYGLTIAHGIDKIKSEVSGWIQGRMTLNGTSEMLQLIRAFSELIDAHQPTQEDYELELDEEEEVEEDYEEARSPSEQSELDLS